MEIKQVRLGNYCSITSSKRIFESEYVSEGIPFFRSKEIIEKEAGKISSDYIYISQQRYDEIKTKFGVPQAGDVLMTSVGTLGVPYIVKENDLFYFKDGNLTWMKDFLPEMDSRYLYYWLKSGFGKQSLIQRAIGSSQAAITIDILKKYQLFLPSIIEQRRVISILSAYDELIEKNNRKIAILQEQAQEIYKEWFVRFRFPGHETAKFENGIPVGWKIVNIFDISNVTYGYPFDSNLFTDDELGCPVVRIRDILDKQTRTYTSENCAEKYRIFANDILIGMDGIFHMCVWSGNPGYLNQRVVKISSKSHNVSNLYLFFSLYPQIQILESSIVGTTVAHLGDKHIKKIVILIPDDDIQVQSTKLFNQFSSEINLFEQQNRKLSYQRDLLLPRLMSGRLEVK